MKKKLLSLFLAGAMVASTSVSAFATTNTTEFVSDGIINGTDDKDYTTNVKIEGSVQSNSGELPSGNFNVTVPTAAAFTVTSEKKLQGANITIENKGNQDVDVYACKFTDLTPDAGITVKKKSEITNEKRTSVSLWVQGELGTAYLSSTPDSRNTGIYSDETLATELEQKKLLTVSKHSNKDLTLEGEAGQSNDEVPNPVSDNFTLVLKIKKSDSR